MSAALLGAAVLCCCSSSSVAGAFLGGFIPGTSQYVLKKMKKLLTLFKTELILSLREFSGVLFGLIMPVGIMLLLGGMFLERGRKRLLKGMRDDASLKEVSG